jgi:cell division septation protein DedD
LALAPRNQPGAEATARTRVAAAPNPPAPRAAAPAAIPAGSYAVQVSSQRSEADAQASYRALQAKFPSQLGGREAVIRRADLGDRGTYFRALVGPFTSSEQAAEFCNGLKAAGGQCLIQRN